MQTGQLKVLILGLPLFISIAVGMTGCANTSETKSLVFVDQGPNTLLRLGPNVEGQVYFWNGKEWELTGKKVKLPEGWLTGPPPVDK